jgi:ribonuclease J
MPLVEKDGKEFDFGKYKNLSTKELIQKSVLPDVEGLYNDAARLIDGVILSHAHADHFGLMNFLNPEIPVYLGEATHEILKLNNIFLGQKYHISHPNYFDKGTTFKIGDFTITPYWADHSAFDAYSFLIEAGGKSIFYSGDFRSHGRKAGAFKWFTHNAPQNVDYLLLEGTTLGRSDQPFKTETEIENEFAEVFKQPGKINLIYTSGQNIDRLTSIYKACKQTKKILVVDIYVATVLRKLSKFAGIPYPSASFKDVRVIYPQYLTGKLLANGEKDIVFQSQPFKITKEEISSQPDKMVMVIRPSLQKELENISGIEGGNIIYSMWDGYLKKPYTIKFIEYLQNRNFTLLQIHTSGHADIETLKQMVNVIKPKQIVPIHTFNGSDYQQHFSQTVIEMKDGETRLV